MPGFLQSPGDRCQANRQTNHPNQSALSKLLMVAQLLKCFCWHIKRCTSRGKGGKSSPVCRQPKVTELQHGVWALVCQQEVLRLDVSAARGTLRDTPRLDLWPPVWQLQRQKQRTIDRPVTSLLSYQHSISATLPGVDVKGTHLCMTPSWCM